MQSIVKNADAEPRVAPPDSIFDTCESAAALPEIKREGIRWSGGMNGTDLVIDLEFENPGLHPTRATSAIVQIAAFGAFVPWRPLTVVSVPPLPPGGRLVLRTAVDPDDPRDLDVPGFGRRAPAQGQRTLQWESTRTLRGLMGRLLGGMRGPIPTTHFIGNLNVFVPGSSPVERHMTAIRLDRNKENIAIFMLGDGRPDDYFFEFESPSPGWSAHIEGIDWGVAVRLDRATLGLSLEPPEGVTSEQVKVWVTRSSTGQRVAVEFELADKPDQAHCYQL